MAASSGWPSVDDLGAALADGRVREVPGFGAATESRLAAELARHAAAEADGEERVPIGSALPVAEEIVRDLRAAVPGARVEVAGSLRRGRESVHDIDLVAAADHPEELQDALAVHPAVERELSRGDAGSSVATHAGVRLELAVGAPEAFGNLLQHATGSAAHNIRLRELAVRQGLSVSQHGILGPDGERATHADEEGVYAALGLHLVPPELREDRGEIEAAREGPLPPLVERGDLRGRPPLPHAAGATARGRSVRWWRRPGSAATPISPSATTPRASRWRGASTPTGCGGSGRRSTPRTPGRTTSSCSRRPRWTSSPTAASTSRTSCSPASTGSRPASTRPSVRTAAASRPACSPRPRARSSTSSGTPPAGCSAGAGTPRSTSRALVAAAAESGTYLEVNAQPRRLDLDAEMARQALAGGARLTIGSDAHSESAFDFIRFGLLVARRAGARPEDVGNTRPWEELAAARRARLAAAGAGQ